MATSESRKMTCLYSQDNVLVYVAGHHEHENAVYNGRITIMSSEPGNTIVLDWCPAHEMEKFDSSDWEEFPSPPAVEFVNNSDMVEIKPQSRKKLQVSFEVYDIRSYRLSEEEDLKLSFYLKDGSTPHSFFFPNKDHDCLITALQKHVKFQQSQQDSNLYLVTDGKKEALEKSFSELQLFDNKKDIVSKFFNDPYTVAMDGFAKVSNGLCNFLLSPPTNSKASYPDSEMAEFLNESLPPFSSLDSNHIDDFEVIPRVLPNRPKVDRSEPLSVEQWNLHIDQKSGKIKHVRQLKKKIFHGGITPSLRPEVWKFLLGYFDFKSTPKEREEFRKQKMDDYYRMKLQWKSLSEEQETRFASFRDRRSLIKKDVERTDRQHPMFSGSNSQPLAMMYDVLMTYCMYNFDLGYVQGMSDLLSPLLVVIKNEPDVFWCFAGFIEKVGSNFEMDQQGMKTQLEQLYTLIHFWDPDFSEYLEMHDSGNMYFFFRWLLILFKRELKFEDVMRVWEVLWTDLPCKNFHLLLCLAIIDREKNTIMENGFGLCEILKHVNDMALKIDIEEGMSGAEGIYLQLLACEHTPTSVREILGLPEHKAEEKLAKIVSSPVSNSTKAVSETSVSPTRGTPSATNHDVKCIEGPRKQDSSPKSSSSVDTSSIEVLSDDVDIESRYEISFGLLM